MFSTYILFSAKLKKYYVGHTADFVDRLRRHNAAQNKSTKAGAPWSVVWKFESETRSEAMLLENKIKERGVNRFLFDINVRGVAQPG